eukprot:UN09940
MPQPYGMMTPQGMYYVGGYTPAYSYNPQQMAQMGYAHPQQIPVQPVQTTPPGYEYDMQGYANPAYNMQYAQQHQQHYYMTKGCNRCQ